MTSTIAVASEEFTYPVMAGFKWRRYFFGFNASPTRRGRSRRVSSSARGAHGRGRRRVHRFLYLFGAVPTVRSVAVDLRRVLAGSRSACRSWPTPHPIETTRAVRARAALRLHADVPVLRHLLPAATLPLWLQWIGWISPLWHATELGRWISYGADRAAMLVVHFGYLIASRSWLHLGARSSRRGSPSERATSHRAATARGGVRRSGRATPAPSSALASSRALVELGVVLSGFFEPVFYLRRWASASAALIATVETTTGPGGARTPRSSRLRLLAVSADERRDLRLDLERLLQAELRQALRGDAVDLARSARRRLSAEILYALLRGLLYATGFMIIMQIAGLNLAWTGDPRDPRRLLIAFGFASLGMAVHELHEGVPADGLDQLRAAADVPVLGDAVPDHGLPEFIQWIVKALPLWHGVELVAAHDGRSHPRCGCTSRTTGDDRDRARLHDEAAAGALPRLSERRGPASQRQSTAMQTFASVRMPMDQKIAAAPSRSSAGALPMPSSAPMMIRITSLTPSLRVVQVVVDAPRSGEMSPRARRSRARCSCAA
jgi:lipooligosaccharide transport system permease protein